ncbi:Translation elongation factor 1 beta [Tieghemiomyces parasiticus]|uniref:Translation elongation factor 1 beta n=1 Tax=Tieghemiomyces parasiticus TaxID=78921 RepID=A0A9W7ZGZ3_9FUNG|nr:Translation elongation factor 1 beta [Tieghemiomyces parasiticus]
MAAVTLSQDTFSKILDGYVENCVNVESLTPSQADKDAVAALKESPNAAQFPRAAEFFAKVNATPAAAPAAADEEDDDIDLFGSDEEEDEEAERLKAQRLEEYRAKKAAKPAVIFKSMVVFDVKPWDDETDMKALEESVRSIEMDGLLWGKSQLIPVGYGIKKLRISCIVEDDKVSTSDLEDKMAEFEDYIQSVDVDSFSKL